MTPNEEYEYWTTPERLRERFGAEINADQTSINYLEDGGPNNYNKTLGLIWWMNLRTDASHRPPEEGPAVISYNSWCGYYDNGTQHRIGGPAVIYFDNSKTSFFRVNGHNMRSVAQYQQASGMNDEEIAAMLMKYPWPRE